MTQSRAAEIRQAWAGAKWGAQHLPRIGQEVIVAFLDGDPDRPIITGSLYNADTMPPYDLPANQTKSGIKSRSSKGGTASNFNEIRFEDKKGREELHLQAEKDMSTLVKNNQTLHVGMNRSIVVGKGLLCGDRDAFANACWGPHLTEEQRYPNGGSGTNPLLFKRERIDLSASNGDTLPQMNLWLLDHLGQRMGANPASPDPLAQSLGACYRLVLPSGAARCGYADADGMVTEYNFPSNVSCLLQWGRREDAIWDGSAMDDDEAEEFFIYSETIFIGLEPPSGDLPTCQLSNLGYEGVATECQQRFAADYGSSMESEIFDVHGSGRPKNSA